MQNTFKRFVLKVIKVEPPTATYARCMNQAVTNMSFKIFIFTQPGTVIFHLYCN